MATLDAVRAHPWPGNIRDLRNVIYEALVYERAGSERLLSDLSALNRPAPASAAGSVPNRPALAAAVGTPGSTGRARSRGWSGPHPRSRSSAAAATPRRGAA